MGDIIQMRPCTGIGIASSGNRAYSMRSNTQPVHPFIAVSRVARMPSLLTAASGRKLALFCLLLQEEGQMEEIFFFFNGVVKNGRNTLPGRTKEIKNGITGVQSERVLFMFAFLGPNY